MIIFTLRTDKPEAEIGLYDNQERLAYCIWPAHRQLAETIHQKIKDLLKVNNKTLNDIESIAVYKGPGSFTGLRIGLSVANALAAALEIPIVASSGEGWLDIAVTK